jgi:FRG domain
MLTQQHFHSWSALEAHVQQLAAERANAAEGSIGHFSHLLYRGHASHSWLPETTLERLSPTITSLAEYYRIVAIAKTQVETFTSRTWADIDVSSVAKHLSEYDALRFAPPPSYDFLVYLRHHGFPSPLLDWSRSLYVAAFFAYQQPTDDHIAIFAYQEYGGAGKSSSSLFPQIHALGPNVRTHPRHFLQQGEYTMCVRFQTDGWHLANHSSVFDRDEQSQDLLWKFTAPASDAPAVIRRLNEYNINAFSLFQTEESLLATLAKRLIPLA